MIDVVIVTENACLKADPKVRHSAMASEEDGVLLAAFNKQNIKCRRIAWEDPDFDWSSTKVALIKTTWNYFHHIPEFINWVKNTSEKCLMVNSKDIIIWNMDKRYLFDLAKNGVIIPETHLLPPKEKFNPEQWNEKLGNKHFVVKPTISGGSKDTFYLKPPYNKVDIALIQEAVENQSMIIQPFINSIVEQGEYSMVFVNSKLTHAMVKRPQLNDFRVQPYHGGTLQNYLPNKREINFGEEVLQVCKKIKGCPIYARVDFCHGSSGELLLMELEVIEPQLWFPESALAVSSMVAAIKNVLD